MENDTVYGANVLSWLKHLENRSSGSMGCQAWFAACIYSQTIAALSIELQISLADMAPLLQ